MNKTNRDIKKINVALKSVYVAIFIVAIKTVASIQSGSLAVLSELFHSSTDLIAALITLFSINYSSRPPDEEHHYGHDKIESFSALLQVLILILMCGYVFYEAIVRLIHPPDIHLNWFTFSAILICIGLDYSRSRALKRIAIETHSQALEADALHFSSDILSSIVVLISMACTYFKISHLFDPVSAIIVSFIIIYVTVKLTKKAINSLMDREPKGVSEKLRNIIINIEEVEEIKTLRVRETGAKIFVDMTILISRLIPLTRSHEITDKIEKKIFEKIPNSDLVIHLEPIETGKETINEKIRMIVNDEGLKCHDIFSHKIDNNIFTELHIEIAGTNDFNTAHDIVSRIEKKIKEQIDIITSVKIHIDEPSELTYETRDITENSKEMIRNINNIIGNYRQVEDFKNIKIISSNDKIRVSLDCEFDAGMSLEKVHDIVTSIESNLYLHLKELYTNLSNVIVHAEPKSKN